RLRSPERAEPSRGLRPPQGYPPAQAAFRSDASSRFGIARAHRRHAGRTRATREGVQTQALAAPSGSVMLGNPLGLTAPGPMLRPGHLGSDGRAAQGARIAAATAVGAHAALLRGVQT